VVALALLVLKRGGLHLLPPEPASLSPAVREAFSDVEAVAQVVGAQPRCGPPGPSALDKPILPVPPDRGKGRRVRSAIGRARTARRSPSRRRSMRSTARAHEVGPRSARRTRPSSRLLSTGFCPGSRPPRSRALASAVEALDHGEKMTGIWQVARSRRSLRSSPPGRRARHLEVRDHEVRPLAVHRRQPGVPVLGENDVVMLVGEPSPASSPAAPRRRHDQTRLGRGLRTSPDSDTDNAGRSRCLPEHSSSLSASSEHDPRDLVGHREAAGGLASRPGTCSSSRWPGPPGARRRRRRA